MKKRTLLILLLVGFLALAGIGYGTFAFFTAGATSEENEISSGTLTMSANGETENFRFDIASTKLVPGDYITVGENNTADIEIRNTGTLDMVYISNFKYSDGKDSNFLSNGLVFENLSRTVRDKDGKVLSTTFYVRDFALASPIGAYVNDIDKYDLKGELLAMNNRPADELISIREWIEFCATKSAALEKVYAGKLEPGQNETWSMKIKFHEKCGNEYNIKNGFNIFLDYGAEATQNRVDAITSMLLAQKVVKLDFNNDDGSFDEIAREWKDTF
ncbi:TasA family protein [Oceanirhabdus sp. W0125-5]|uniref:TasA family protein n=1 Tax=Oceanirhabdus sp. W0125-5 TaxID=2999116 RepID=UPI0022F33101|nr:TasA family protein [Oceanirhabdus sp. W0125-5]WBW96188.1 TasA family protein [Oceanirhabdus sp. W0125-5]